ncbi:ATP-binding protein [uncultured Methanobrevibacter sp.]|uniref:ATP-binding protein n=1 Tax=uncultured Methanobrevibacter sp. TaxID=253161 RepID=UPI002602C2AA|nr:ATP-binding protein [uncultured Methanobrevibacter sp.]
MVERELYMSKIRRLIDLDIIKVITGVRRCGKSYMLNLIIDELQKRGVNKQDIFLINFDSIKYQNIKNSNELNDLILELVKEVKGKIYLFFDEIQNVKNWEKSITAYKIDFDCDIYITGSNSNLLSGELVTHLTGRYMEIKMYPFSFKEFLDYKQSDDIKLFDEYLKYGGLPFIFSLSPEDKLQYLNDLYYSIIYKDLISRYEIRDVNLLERLVLYIINNIGNTFSAKSISDYLKHENIKVSNKTIYNYLVYLENACLISKVKREDLQGKKILKFQEKYYVVDHGFNQALLGKNNMNEGRVLENIVYNEFLRRGYEVTVGKINGYEIDFVCKKPDKTIYVQVSYILGNDNTIEREFRPLLKINDNYSKYVISLDQLDFSRQGIVHLNLLDFLTDYELIL